MTSPPAPEPSELIEIYLELDPTDIAFVKFIFESYEGVAIVRTVDRKRAVIALLVVPDFRDDARRILDDLQRRVRWTELPRDVGRDLGGAFL